MRKYLLHLILLSLLMVIATFIVMWTNPRNFLVAMPLTVLYFTVITLFEHLFIVKSAYKEPRIFIKNFLGTAVGSMLLHLVVIVIYAFTHLQQAKVFLIAFIICYIVYLVFETAELIHFVRSQKSQQ